MLTEDSSYREIRRVLLAMYRRLIERNPLTIPGLRGKYERARFRGERYVYQEAVVNGQPVTIEYDVQTKTFSLKLVIMGERRRMVVTSLYYHDDMFLQVLTSHAVERYMQRALKHDESAVLTDEEFLTFADRFIRRGGECHCMTWDEATGAYLYNYEGGAFIVGMDVDEKVVMLKTFLPVSKMKLNQSLANGRARRKTLELNRGYDRLARKRDGGLGTCVVYGIRKGGEICG